ncbi:MAG TPA: multiheme c-type cytochrome [Blastocatellia bacterium]|jgi:2',3'-cyclic-nucleotide 2'-phosphodiesterase (5'-nucleotidase family)|nr:multiheme c-type cytochrome [Blastocatellia bacterium]
MGGLARRVSYTKAFREKLTQVPSLLVDSGYFLADERGAHGDLRPDVRAKDEAVFKSYDQFPVDVANISSHDLRYISRLLAKSEFARRAETHPILKRLVSANAASDSPDAMPPQPFVVKEIPGRQVNGATTKPVKVAFVGLTEMEPPAPLGFKYMDAVEAARRAVPEARKQASLVIVLANARTEEAARIAREVPGIDIILASSSQANDLAFTPPITVGQTLVAFTSYETRMLGELRFYRDGQDKFSTKIRFITLDETIPDDPAAAQAVTAARDVETNARAESKTTLGKWLEMSRAHSSGTGRDRNVASESSPGYVSSSGCAQCHAAQYVRWANSAHAHASDPLPPRQFEFEVSCLSCHATGIQKASATPSIEMARLQNVQCEQCHGPGGEHAAKPGKGYGRIANLQSACSTCHTRQVSPGFDVEAAWAKIKH